MTTEQRRATLAKATTVSAAAKRRAAVQAYARLLPLISRLSLRGLSFGQIAAQLNAQGHRTRTGKRWHAAQVWRVLDRARQEARP
jgi:hypothetical protein